MTGNYNVKPKNKMLKLLKNDFLASARVISLFYLIEAVTLVLFFIGTKIEGNNKDKFLAIGMVGSVLVAFLLIFVTFFFVVYDYRKALFSEQGYLSFSLPVTSNQLLGSKMIIYGAWMLVSYAVFYEVLKYTAIYAQDEVVGEQMMGIAESLLTEMLGFPSKAQIVAIVVYFVVLFFVIVLSLVSMIYFAITASYVRPLNKHSILSGIVVFIVNSLVFLKASDILGKYIDFALAFGSDGTVALTSEKLAAESQINFNIAFIFYLVVQGVVLFFLTSYLMHKKVNVK